MLKQISTLIIICFAGIGVLAQTEIYTAPVKWERYKVSDKSVSVLFPKLPVLIQNVDACSEMETRRYAVYAENVVYGLNITFQINQKPPDFCRQIQGLRKFDEKRFEDRLNELAASLKTEKTEKITRNNLEVIKVSGEIIAYWLINDFKNKRWFEVWTTEKDETNLRIKNFVESIKIEKNLSGIEIEKGATRTLGDEVVDNDNKDSQKAEVKAGLEKTETKTIRTVVIPKPGYTDAARNAQIQGMITLRVVFLASGGIGSITPVNSLPDGLTEQAIAAAKKIVFIPARKNDTNVTILKTVQYNFSIY